MPRGQGTRKRLRLSARQWVGTGAAFLLALTADTAVHAGPRTPTEILFVAVAKGDAALVGHSLAAGADPLARTPSGRTPQALAISLGHAEIAKMLATAEARASAGTMATAFVPAAPEAGIALDPFSPRAQASGGLPIVGSVRDKVKGAEPTAIPESKPPENATESEQATSMQPAPSDLTTDNQAEPRTESASPSVEASAPTTADSATADPVRRFFRALTEMLASTPGEATAPPPVEAAAPAQSPEEAPRATPPPAAPDQAQSIAPEALSRQNPAGSQEETSPAADPLQRFFASVARMLEPTPGPAVESAPSAPSLEAASVPPTVEAPVAPVVEPSSAAPSSDTATRPKAATEGASQDSRGPVSRFFASLAQALAPTPAPPWQDSTPSAPAAKVEQHASANGDIAMAVAPPLPGPDPEPKYEMGPVTVSLSFDPAMREGGAAPPANARVVSALPPRQDVPADERSDAVPKAIDPASGQASPAATSFVAALAETAPRAAPEPSPFSAPVMSPERHPALKDIRLALGQSATAGRPLAEFGPSPRDCIAKAAWSAAFCVVAIDWPQAVAAHFDVGAAEYHGTQAIVRIESDRAIHYHALFHANAFAAIREHFAARFGPVTEAENPPMPTIGRPNQRNAVLRWRSRESDGQATILEIRAYDDMRGYLPDPAHGVVRLYIDGARPVFGQLNTADLMLRRMRGTPVNPADIR